MEDERNPAPVKKTVGVKPLEWRHDGEKLYAYCGVTDTRWTASNSVERERAESTRETRILSVVIADNIDVEDQRKHQLATIVAWRLRHMNDGPHMWEYYPLSQEKTPSETSISQDLTVQQLIDILNDDRHATAQERNPEPHAPSYLMEAFRDAWKMASEAGAEDDWEDAFSFWRPPFAADPARQTKLMGTEE